MLSTDDPVVIQSPPAPPTRARRSVEAVAFVAIWMAAGLLLGADANLYLLVGVPLTAAFQLLVRRRPLRELWVRQGPPFRLDATGIAIAVALMAVPAVLLVQAVLAREWVVAGWLLACVAGALPAAYALRQVRSGDTTPILHWLVTATVTGSAILIAMIAPALAASDEPLRPWTMLAAGLQAVIVYFPVTFVLEEVSFRGALDAHVSQPGEGRGWLSALLVSALWGLWHLPIAEAGPAFPMLLAQTLLVHGAIGVTLSLAWRRTGSLLVPCLAHAMIDGIRNALLAGL